MNPDSTKTRKPRVNKTDEQKLAEAEAKLAKTKADGEAAVAAAKAKVQAAKNKREDAANKVIDAARLEWPHCGEDRKEAVAELVDAWREVKSNKEYAEHR